MIVVIMKIRIKKIVKILPTRWRSDLHNCIISSHSAGSHETNKATLHNTWGCDHT